MPMSAASPASRVTNTGSMSWGLFSPIWASLALFHRSLPSSHTSRASTCPGTVFSVPCRQRSMATSLTRLLHVDMSYNLISGVIPPAIANLTRLIVLEMSRNLITGQVPVELSNLSNLRGFDLSYNQLHGIIPSSLAMLRQLGYIILTANNLSGNIAEAIFINCTMLAFEIGGNNLFGEIPRTASSTLSSTQLPYSTSTPTI